MNIHDRAAQLRAMLAHDVSGSYGGAMERAAEAVNTDLLVVESLQDRAVSPAPAFNKDILTVTSRPDFYDLARDLTR